MTRTIVFIVDNDNDDDDGDNPVGDQATKQHLNISRPNNNFYFYLPYFHITIVQINIFPELSRIIYLDDNALRNHGQVEEKYLSTKPKTKKRERMVWMIITR